MQRRRGPQAAMVVRAALAISVAAGVLLVMERQGPAGDASDPRDRPGARHTGGSTPSNPDPHSMSTDRRPHSSDSIGMRETVTIRLKMEQVVVV